MRKSLTAKFNTRVFAGVRRDLHLAQMKNYAAIKSQLLTYLKNMKITNAFPENPITRSNM